MTPSPPAIDAPAGVGDVDEFWGRRELLADLDSFGCKGNWLAARRRYVEAEYGARAVDAVAQRLESDALRRAFLDPPLPMSWSNVATVAAIDWAIFEGPMRGSIARMRAFGGEIARYDVGGLYRALFRVTTPRFVFSKMGIIWSLYYRRGTLRSEASDGDATIVLEGATLPRYLCAHGCTGWLDTMVALVGGRSPDARHSRCVHDGDDRCEWTVAWQRR